MPLYEYQCADCTEIFTKMRKMAEAAEKTDCPKCGSNNSTRIISACAIGSGKSGGALGGFG